MYRAVELDDLDSRGQKAYFHDGVLDYLSPDCVHYPFYLTDTYH